MNVKNIVFIFVFIFSFQFVFSQSNFQKGFSDGYKEGYCHDKGIGCVSPIPPITPIPTINESYNSYQDGYNRGFKMGLDASKKEKQQNTYENRRRYQAPTDYEPVQNVIYQGTSSEPNYFMLGLLIVVASPFLLSSDIYVNGMGYDFSKWHRGMMWYPTGFGFRNSWLKHFDFEYGVTIYDDFNVDLNVLYNFIEKRHAGIHDVYRKDGIKTFRFNKKKEPVVNPFIGITTRGLFIWGLQFGGCAGVNIAAGNMVKFSFRYTYLYDLYDSSCPVNCFEIGCFLKYQRAAFSIFK